MTSARARTVSRLVGVVFVAAVVVRLLYLWSFRTSPFFDQLMVDARWHDRWAWDWARGLWSLDGASFFRAPLYPLWLASLYRVFGHDPAAVRLVAAILGASACAATAGTAWRVAGSRAAWAAGLIAAFYGTLAYFDGELLIPNLLVSLLAWAAFAAIGVGGPRGRSVAAVLIGLAGIARPNALVLLLPLALLSWGAPGNERKHGVARLDAAAARRSGRVLGASFLILLGLLPAIGVTLVNFRSEGTVVFVASQGGVNFAAGNHAGATGRTGEVPELGRLMSWETFRDRSREVAETAAGRSLTSREVSDFWFRRGLAWIRAHPSEAAVLTLKKLYYLANGFEGSNNRDPYLLRPVVLRPLLWKTPWFAFPWGLVFPLAVAGAFLGIRERSVRRSAVFLTLWVVLYGASLLPFFVCARFRMGMVPALLILAAVPIAAGRRFLRRAPLTVFAAALLVSNSSLFGVRTENPALERTRLGAVLLEAGEMQEGISNLERAVALDPTDPVAATILADAYREDGRFDDARRFYERVVSLRPGDAKARFDLGVAYLQLERYDDAANALETATRLDSEDGAAWIDLGAAYEGRGWKDKAIEAYRRGIEIAPRAEIGYHRLGALYLARDEIEKAVAVLAEGTRRLPTSFLLRFELAAAEIRAGRYAAALERVDAALALSPGNADALRMQAWLREKLRERR